MELARLLGPEGERRPVLESIFHRHLICSKPANRMLALQNLKEVPKMHKISSYSNAHVYFSHLVSWLTSCRLAFTSSLITVHPLKMFCCMYEWKIVPVTRRPRPGDADGRVQSNAGGGGWLRFNAAIQIVSQTYFYWLWNSKGSLRAFGSITNEKDEERAGRKRERETEKEKDREREREKENACIFPSQF